MSDLFEDLAMCEDREWLHGALETLETIDRRISRVLRLYYMGRRTFRDIGSILGLSCERVRQIRNEGIRILKKLYNNQFEGDKRVTRPWRAVLRLAFMREAEKR